MRTDLKYGRLGCGALLLLLLAPMARAGSCPAGYDEVARSGAMVECSRAVSGSSYLEYLVLTSVTLAPDSVASRAWARILEKATPGLKKRDFLVSEPRRLVFYDQIKTPVVSDRDYTCEAIRVDGPSGRIGVRFATRNDLGPPLEPKYVRIPSLRAVFTFEPDGKGGTNLSYSSYSEPGGSVPAWMVRNAQAKHALADVEALVRALGKTP
jgi:START domain